MCTSVGTTSTPDLNQKVFRKEANRKIIKDKYVLKKSSPELKYYLLGRSSRYISNSFAHF